MPKRMPWFRMYSEILSDPKVAALTGVERWLWIALLCVASEANRRGMVEAAEGMPLSDDTLLRLAGLSGVAEEDGNLGKGDGVAGAIDRFERLGMIERHEDGTLHIAHWEERQFESDLSTERSRRHRRRSLPEHDGCNGDATVMQRCSNGDATAMQRPQSTDPDPTPSLIPTPEMSRKIENNESMSGPRTDTDSLAPEGLTLEAQAQGEDEKTVARKKAKAEKKAQALKRARLVLRCYCEGSGFEPTHEESLLAPILKLINNDRYGQDLLAVADWAARAPYDEWRNYYEGRQGWAKTGGPFAESRIERNIGEAKRWVAAGRPTMAKPRRSPDAPKEPTCRKWTPLGGKFTPEQQATLWAAFVAEFPDQADTEPQDRERIGIYLSWRQTRWERILAEAEARSKATIPSEGKDERDRLPFVS